MINCPRIYCDKQLYRVCVCVYIYAYILNTVFKKSWHTSSIKLIRYHRKLSVQIRSWFQSHGSFLPFKQLSRRAVVWNCAEPCAENDGLIPQQALWLSLSHIVWLAKYLQSKSPHVVRSFLKYKIQNGWRCVYVLCDNVIITTGQVRSKKNMQSSGSPVVESIWREW